MYRILNKCFCCWILFFFVYIQNLSFATEIEGGGINDAIIGGIKKADQLYNNLEYHKAIPYYEAYLKKNDNN